MIKYLGRKTVIDENGNEIELDMISKSYDLMDKKGWRRVVIGDLLSVLDQIGNKKIKVLEFLIDNMNSNNEINFTQREIQQKTGISLQTINETIKALTEANIIKKHKRIYVLNPQITSAYGSKEKNTMLCINYEFHDGAIKSEQNQEQLKNNTKQNKEIQATTN